MFPRNRVTGVTGSRIKTESYAPKVAHAVNSPHTYSEKSKIQASVGGNGWGQQGGGNSMSVNSYWSSQYQYYMTGLIPSEPGYADTSQLALFYRDIYLHDATAGSCVDIQSTFPFSDFDLRGLDEKDLNIYRDSVDQLNINQMLPIISTAYLTDGFFCGSLVFDQTSRRFLDTLIHDALQCQIMPNSFFNMMPQINVHTSQATNELLNSDSQYSREYLSYLPQSFIELLKTGAFTLNPVSTLYVARRSLTDRAYVSFLHRILPMYLIEKTMFRGTLVEASRRQRATTHLTAGDDIWTPTGEELQALVSQFQQAEFDPLGGWVSTRNAVQVNDIRPGGDFWKWTDMADILVAYKLRAMGVSESFLSGEASYAAAESAYSTFLESQDTYRRHLTNAIFDTTLFPLIAVANNLYKEGTANSERVQHNQVTKYLMHAKNRSRLLTPQLVWHKSLEAKGEENTFEMLEQASEKGVPIPIRMWMAAAGLDVESLIKDLDGDVKLRKKLESFTGKDTSHEGEEQVEASAVHAALKRLLGIPTTSSSKNSMYPKRSILGRSWGEPEDFSITKTGQKRHIVHNAQGKRRDYNAAIATMSHKMATDPEYRVKMAKANISKLGYSRIPLAGDVKGR
jgi:hypothetical protein